MQNQFNDDIQSQPFLKAANQLFFPS